MGAFRPHRSGPLKVAYDFCQAKEEPVNEKGLRLFDADGMLIDAINLNESGWQAHARIIEALMQPVPDMRHTLSDAIAVMELFDLSRGLACEAPGYPFGDLPHKGRFFEK
jgi:hypothetical protein